MREESTGGSFEYDVKHNKNFHTCDIFPKEGITEPLSTTHRQTFKPPKISKEKQGVRKRYTEMQLMKTVKG